MYKHKLKTQVPQQKIKTASKHNEFKYKTVCIQYCYY